MDSYCVAILMPQMRMSVRMERMEGVSMCVTTLKEDSTAAVMMATFSQTMEEIASVRTHHIYTS